MRLGVRTDRGGWKGGGGEVSAAGFGEFCCGALRLIKPLLWPPAAAAVHTSYSVSDGKQTSSLGPSPRVRLVVGVEEVAGVAAASTAHITRQRNAAHTRTWGWQVDGTSWGANDVVVLCMCEQLLCCCLTCVSRYAAVSRRAETCRLCFCCC